MDTLIETLRQLDPANDAHWTQNGLPRLDVLSASIGSDVTRNDVAAAAPSFRRDHLELPAPVEPEPEAPTNADMAEDVAATRALLEQQLSGVRVQIENCRGDVERIKQRQSEFEDEEIRISTLLQEKYPELSPGERMKRHVQRQHEYRVAAAKKAESAGQQVGAPSPLDKALAARPRPYQQVVTQPAPGPVTPRT